MRSLNEHHIKEIRTLKVCYTAHLSAGLGNISTIEGIPSYTLDADLSDYKLMEGILHISEDASGFGMKLTII